MSSVAEFIDELTDIIALLSAECTDNIVVSGDLNCPGPAPEHVDVRLAAAFESMGLSQLVSAATRDDSLLDVLVTSSPALLSGANVDDANQISDHLLVTARLVVHNPKPPIAVKWRRLRDVDLTSFEASLRRSELFARLADGTDEFAAQLVRVDTDELDNVAPVRSGSRRPPKTITKWLSAEAVSAKRKRRRMERRWQRTRKEKNRLEY